MKSKTTKRSLAMSLLSLVLCFAMLIGSTYAWFSDTADTKEVNITAGNLDVEIVDSTDQPFTEENKLFKDVTKLEPGMMIKSQEFKIQNAGTLALTYTVTIDQAEVIEQDKTVIDLSKVLSLKVVKASEVTSANVTDQASRKQLWNSLTGDKELTSGVIYPAEGKGVTGDPAGETKDPLVAVLYWKPTNSTSMVESENPDNKYNFDDLNEKVAETNITLNVFATQTPAEKDSFGEKYDGGLVPANAKELNAALDAAKGADGTRSPVNVTLGADMLDFEREGKETAIAIAGGSTIDGAGHAVTATNNGTSVFVVIPGEETTTTIKNITIENKAKSDNGKSWGLVIGHNSGNSEGNVIVENCVIKSKDGYAVGVNNGATVTFRDCTFDGWSALEVADGSKVTLENCTLTGTNTKDGENNLYGTVNLWGTNCQLTIKGNVTINAVKTGDAGQFSIFGRKMNDTDVKGATRSQIHFEDGAKLTITENGTGTEYTSTDNIPFHTVGYDELP